MLKEEERKPREGSSDRRDLGDQYRRDDRGYDDRRRGDQRGPDTRTSDPRFGDSRGGREAPESGRRGYEESQGKGRYPEEKGGRDQSGGPDRFDRKRDRPDDRQQGQEPGYKRLKEDEKDPRSRPEEGDYRKRQERHPVGHYSDLSEGGSDEARRGSPALRDKQERDRPVRRADPSDDKGRPQRDSSRESSRDGSNYEKRSFDPERDRLRDPADRSRERTHSKEPESSQRGSSRANSMDRSEHSVSQTQRSRRSMSRGSTGSRSSSITSARGKHEDTDGHKLQDQRSRASSRDKSVSARQESVPDGLKEVPTMQEEADGKAEVAGEKENQQIPEPVVSNQPSKPSIDIQAPVQQDTQGEKPLEGPPLEDKDANIPSLQDDYEDISDEEFDDNANGDRSRRVKNGSQADSKPGRHFVIFCEKLYRSSLFC